METLGSRVVDPTLLPDLSAWLAVNPSATFDDYARDAIQPGHFFAIGSLLWPRLVRHRGGLFWKASTLIASINGSLKHRA